MKMPPFLTEIIIFVIFIQTGELYWFIGFMLFIVKALWCIYRHRPGFAQW